MSALQGIMLATRVEPGCLGCGLSTEVDSRVVIRYVEEWADEKHLERELQSARFAALAELMEGASEPPLVEFTLHESTRGLDYAKEVRSRPAHLTGRRA